MANQFGFFNEVEALRARFWKRSPAGSSAYPGAGLKPPFSYTVDQGFPDYAFDLNGNPQKYLVAADSLGRTALSSPWGIGARSLQTIQEAVPVFAASNVTNGGTAGSTSYSYKILGVQGAAGALAFSGVSAAGTTTTGAATLTGANYNILTFTPTVPYGAYLIYRTASSGTPSTTGIIGLVFVTPNADGSLATITFLDTGIAGDGTTGTTVNSTGIIQAPLYGDIATQVLSTPVNVAGVANGTTGTNSAYKIVALSQNGHTAASSAVTISGAGTLTAVNSNTISWNAVPGALQYQVYRTTAPGTPSTTGLIGTVNAGAIPATGLLSFTDTGLAGDSSTAPTTNTTGGASIAGPLTSGGINFIATETGTNNTIAGSLPGATLAEGLSVTVKLAHTLQAGANTFNLNAGGAVAIKSHFNVASNIATVYAATGTITLLYDGTEWLDMSQ